MAYVLIVTIQLSNLLHIRSEVPHRFPSLEACEAFYVEYAKEARYPADASGRSAVAKASSASSFSRTRSRPPTSSIRSSESASCSVSAPST